MADRKVTRTGKGIDGDISLLCHLGAQWSPRSKEGAIRDIQTEAHSYFVKLGRRRIEIFAVVGKQGTYLRTDPDWTAVNALVDLPDC